MGRIPLGIDDAVHDLLLPKGIRRQFAGAAVIVRGVVGGGEIVVFVLDLHTSVPLPIPPLQHKIRLLGSLILRFLLHHLKIYSPGPINEIS